MDVHPIASTVLEQEIIRLNLLDCVWCVYPIPRGAIPLLDLLQKRGMLAHQQGSSQLPIG